MVVLVLRVRHADVETSVVLSHLHLPTAEDCDQFSNAVVRGDDGVCGGVHTDSSYEKI